MMWTRHLTADELVSALDLLPDARVARHLESCATCRAALADLEDMQLRARGAADVPEPSPLFWEHLSARVRAETDSSPIPRATIWWRPLTALGALAALVLVVLVARPSIPKQPIVATDAAATDEASWTTMAQIASTLSRDEVQVAVASAPERPFAVNDLTPREREAFVRLLDVEMGRMR